MAFDETPKLVDSDAPDVLTRALLAADLPGECWSAGDSGLAAREPRIGVVGSRQASPESLLAIEALATELARRRAVVVSGGAVGTDHSAHRACLQAGGATIVCLPGGLAEHRLEVWRPELSEAAAVGELLLVSPFPYRQPITRSTPVIRNRLIATLAQAVVVGEAGPNSGTLHCVRAARDRRVPVFFLSRGREEPRDVRLLHRRLQAEGCLPATPEMLLASSFVDRVLEAARRHERQRASEEARQGQLFDGG